MSWLNAPVNELSDRMLDRPVARAIGTVLFFAFVGPIAGGMVIWLLDLAVSIFRSGDFWGMMILSLVFAPFGVMALVVALVFAFVPAAIAGTFFAVVDFGRVRSNVGLAIVVGALGGWFWPLVWGLPPSDLSSYHPEFIASVVATVLCWHLSTRRTRRDETAPT